MAEESDDPLDRLFHAVKILEGRIDPDRPADEDPADARPLAGVDELRLADRGEHALGRARIRHRLACASLQIVLKRHLRFLLALVEPSKETGELIVRVHDRPRRSGPSTPCIYLALTEIL